jgi:hypothetical protein
MVSTGGAEHMSTPLPAEPVEQELGIGEVQDTTWLEGDHDGR